MTLAEIVPSGEPLKKLPLAVALGAALIVATEPNHTDGLPILAAFALWYAYLLLGAGIFLLSNAFLQRLACPAPYDALVPALFLPLPFALMSLVVDYGFAHAADDIAAATGGSTGRRNGSTGAAGVRFADRKRARQACARQAWR
jgi:hypothetical protein